jgi:hypothetical protein
MKAARTVAFDSNGSIASVREVGAPWAAPLLFEVEEAGGAVACILVGEASEMYMPMERGVPHGCRKARWCVRVDNTLTDAEQVVRKFLS